MSRYILQTEHIRGERRIYWVEDSQKKYGRGYEQVTPHTTSERKAQHQCDKLNEACAIPQAERGPEA